VKIDLWTPPGGLTLRSPSLYYNRTSERWTMFGVNDDTDNLFWMTSTTKDLDASGQWGATTTAVVDGNPAFSTIEMRFIGNRWVGMALADSTIQILQSKGALATAGFAISGTAISPVTSPGKATWLQRDDGNMDVWYHASSVMYRTAATGPAPVQAPGDALMDYYGPWTKMFTVYDEDESHPPTQADLNSQARRNLTGRSPVPIEVRVPDNSTLKLGPGLSFDQLVPGTTMPLLATLNSRQVSQDQKLDKLTVTEDSTKETIQVTLVPTTKPDSDEEEED
jgi:hypothetical protein